MWLGPMYRILRDLFKVVTSYDEYQHTTVEVWPEQKRQNAVEILPALVLIYRDLGGGGWFLWYLVRDMLA